MLKDMQQIQKDPYNKVVKRMVNLLFVIIAGNLDTFVEIVQKYQEFAMDAVMLDIFGKIVHMLNVPNAIVMGI